MREGRREKEDGERGREGQTEGRRDGKIQDEGRDVKLQLVDMDNKGIGSSTHHSHNPFTDMVTATMFITQQLL